jgi:plasmid maintenance system antidote protein VapI
MSKAGCSNAETWLGAQLAYDLWQAKQRAGTTAVKPYPIPELPALI